MPFKRNLYPQIEGIIPLLSPNPKLLNNLEIAGNFPANAVSNIAVRSKSGCL